MPVRSTTIVNGVVSNILENGIVVSVGEGTPDSYKLKGKDGDRYHDNNTNYDYLYNNSSAFAFPSKSPWVNISNPRIRTIIKNGVLVELDQTVDLNGLDITLFKGRNGLGEYTLVNTSDTKDSIVAFSSTDKLKTEDGAFGSYIVEPNKIVKFVYINPYWRISNLDTTLDKDEILSEAKCFAITMAAAL